MRVLGIETSCDETGVAVYDSDRGLLTHVLYSQVAVHAEYGGVVPELASRDHVRKLLPLIRQVMADADLSAKDIDGVAYTAGPGLIGALMVGASLGRALAYAWQVPAIGVHHMEGHLLAPMLEKSPPDFPFVALLVSGGHTQLIEVQAIGQYRILGESVDDAAGFPRPMTDRPGLDFSFSGLKTYTLNTIAEHRGDDVLPDRQTMADIACAFQEAVVDTLAIKCRRALEQTGLTTLVIAGGVSANSRLREKLGDSLARVNGRVFYARHEFCTDNGAMIAYAGCCRLMAGQQEDLAIRTLPRWPMDTLPALAVE